MEPIDELKSGIVDKIASLLQQKYGFRRVKCIDLAVSASWWSKDYSAEELANMSIDELFSSVCKEIDNDEIL